MVRATDVSEYPTFALWVLLRNEPLKVKLTWLLSIPCVDEEISCSRGRDRVFRHSRFK